MLSLFLLKNLLSLNVQRENVCFCYSMTLKSRPVDHVEKSAVKPVVQHGDAKESMSLPFVVEFAKKVIQSTRLPVVFEGVLGTGSYGLVITVMNTKTQRQSVLKISRVSEERLKPIKFPCVNGQRTNWHSLALKDQKRGIMAQIRLYKEFFGLIRIPKLQLSRLISMEDKSSISCILMEKVHGISLHRALDLEKIEERIKELLVRRAGHILKKLHAKNVIHADYHSWNVMCDSKCHLYLIDFDRSTRSDKPLHRLHDIAMMLDTINMKYWQHFTHGYYGVVGAAVPIVLTTPNFKEQSAEMHVESRRLFALYIQDLRAGSTLEL